MYVIPSLYTVRCILYDGYHPEKRSQREHHPSLSAGHDIHYRVVLYVTSSINRYINVEKDTRMQKKQKKRKVGPALIPVHQSAVHSTQRTAYNPQ